jgi:primosomal protein N' (replication factor Y) (superfamily II helicase)
VKGEARLTVADVGIDSRSAGAHAVYTYAAPDGTEVGQAWLVPLGPRRAVGFVLAVRSVLPGELGFDAGQLKPLGSRIEGLSLPAVSVEMIAEVARQTLSPPAVALSVVAPPGASERLVTSWQATPAADGASGLTAAQDEVLRVLRSQGSVEESRAKPLPDGSRSALRALLRKGLVGSVVRLGVPTERHRLTGLLRLTADAAKVDAFLTGPGKRRPAQSVTLMRLQGSESASFSVQEIKNLGGVTDQTIKALVQAGLLEPAETGAAASRPAPDPNPDQSAAISAISAAIAGRKPDGFLLFGVTGSGKTEVYLRAAAEALRAGRQVLYLVPEIALTAQVVAQLRERFGGQVALVHSNMTPSERLESWQRVRSGDSAVVLGPRSAVFAPFEDLGLIVVDEEHEASYKQESSPRYQAKALASWLSRRFSCPIVFGSATPSIESFYAAEQGGLTRLDLPARAASAKLPAVHVEDLGALYRERRPSLLSPRLHEAVSAALGRKEQVILFLNRRAYAPFLVCRECGHRWTCGQCAVSLAFHRKDRRLRCHHCGHQEPAPDTCPECEGTKVAPFGVGAEKVEETVGTEFPEARVARLDRDVARRKGALEEILASFRSGETDVLVGTQMVAKGLDFPNVTVVGVVAADISLNVPDFRASERTFQLLSQVAGRAGRGRSPGEVVIQTLSPDHVAVLSARDHDYVAFYNALLDERRQAGYPPYTRLVNVVFTGESRAAVVEASAVVAQKIRSTLADMVLGPADCPIERLNGLWRRHVLVKLSPGGDPGPVQAALEGVSDRRVRAVIDVDPASLV